MKALTRHRLIFTSAVPLLLLISPTFAVDSDGDGLLDVVDVRNFNPESAGFVNLSFREIEDLDGTNQLTQAKHLDLNCNRFTSIEIGDFDNLTNLQRLSLEGYPSSSRVCQNNPRILEIQPGSFRDLKSLEALSLEDHHLSEIDREMLQGLVNLKGLSLHRNGITHIAPGSFLELTQLEWLDLGGNQVERVERGTFQGLAKLTSLDLQSTTIDVGAFQELTNLEMLDVRGGLISIKKGHFDGLINLQKLELDTYDVTDLEPGAFRELGNLQSLHFGGTQITRLQRGSFDGLTNLRWLTLGGDHLTYIEPGAFRDLASLRVLDLRRQPIEILEGETFHGLTNLGILEIGGVQRIEEGAFRGLDNLRILDMTSSQITNVGPRAFDGLTHLQRLYLGEVNAIDDQFHTLDAVHTLMIGAVGDLKDGAFEGMRELKSLWLGAVSETLNLAHADLASLGGCLIEDFPHHGEGYLDFVGLCISGTSETLILDGATVTDEVLESIFRNSNGMGRIMRFADLSIVGLKFADRRQPDLTSLLNLETLRHITVDQALFERFADEFAAFEAVDENVLSVISYGDADGDGHVNVDDLLRLSANYGRVGGWSDGDFSGDGQVQFDDFLLLSARYETVTASSVPEPGAHLIFILGFCAAWQRPRRSCCRN